MQKTIYESNHVISRRYRWLKAGLCGELEAFPLAHAEHIIGGKLDSYSENV